MISPKGALPIATNKQFWLASGSPRRLDLLAQIGVTPDRVVAPDIDETPAKRERPSAYAKRLAGEKARFVLAQEEAQAQKDVLVLAADTVVAVGARILPKAETAAQAENCLDLLSGRAHRVYSGICLIGADGRPMVRLVTSRVSIKRLNKTEISAYLDSGEWQGKAGGYAIQGRAAAFVRQLQGSYSNVVGLPLYEVGALLRGAGYNF